MCLHIKKMEVGWKATRWKDFSVDFSVFSFIPEKTGKIFWFWAAAKAKRNLTPHKVTWAAVLGTLLQRAFLSHISNYKSKAFVLLKECPKLVNRCGKQILEWGKEGGGVRASEIIPPGSCLLHLNRNPALHGHWKHTWDLLKHELIFSDWNKQEYCHNVRILIVAKNTGNQSDILNITALATPGQRESIAHTHVYKDVDWESRL